MDEAQVTQQAAENTSVAEDSNAATSPVDEQNTSTQAVTDSQSEQAPVSEPEAGETTQESERKPSRAERRIRDLSDKVRQLQQQPNQPLAGLQQTQQFEPGREYSADELQNIVVQNADAIANIRAQQQTQQLRAEMQLDRDVEVLPTKYAELDENSEQFTPELVESIEQEYQQRAFNNGALDPSVRLADIAARHVKAARAAATKATANMKNAVAKQADTAAVKPTGAAPQDKPIDSMTSSELEAHMKSQGRFVKA